MLSKFGNDVALNEQLFKRVQLIYDIKDELNLTEEQDTLLTKKYKSFVRNGANLNESDKIKLRKIDAELSKLKLNFGENVLAESVRIRIKKMILLKFFIIMSCQK